MDTPLGGTMETIKQVLMRRDALSSDAADELIAEAKEQLQEYLANKELDAAENICEEFFGLEPDYIFDLM